MPAGRTTELWERLMALGETQGIAPVGVEAWMLLRTEKGFLHVGADTDGTTTPDDVGWGHVLKRTDDFVGRRSLTRPANLAAGRLQFVGLVATDGGVLPVGAHVRAPKGGSDGYVTSSAFSPILSKGVALGMVAGGRARLGEEVHLALGDRRFAARLVSPGAYDPKGERLHV